MQSALNHPPYALERIAFFPLTGNPAGFHHLLLAECVLRQFLQLEQIVFILSNGKHPDPTKEQAIANRHVRKDLLLKALEGFGDPRASYLAKLAQDHQDTLKLNKECASISTVEFDYEHPVTLYEHVMVLKAKALSAEEAKPIFLIVGGDLIHRMSNPSIFSESHMQALAKHCNFLIAPRETPGIHKAMATLEQMRGITLEFQEIDLDHLSEALRGFLQLSSTLIRQAIQAQHALTCFLPAGAAQIIRDHQLYLHNPSLETLSEWEQACRKQEFLLNQTARQLQRGLDQRAEQKLPHTLAIVETSTGGRLSAALAALPGISQHFKESAVLYDQAAKHRLLGQSSPHAAVTPEMAKALAEEFQKKTQADFVLAETGMAGPPEGLRHSQKQGHCCLALATPDSLSHQFHQSPAFLSKKEHQLIFAHTALDWLSSHV